ncbi:MAG: MarR family transcriptional regulator [Hyphomonadaceae bacterium]|nr:MarR family transcriptional regulator [Hyphomonadaceae bacterium]
MRGSAKKRPIEEIDEAWETPTRSRRSIGTLYLISYAFHASRTRLEKALRKYGLTGIQYTILDILSHQAGQSSAQLSRRFIVTPQTMGEMVAGLERRGVIKRVANPKNRRVLQTFLTAEGERLLRQAAKDVARIEAQMFKDLDAASLRRLREILFRLNAQMRAQIDSEN